MLSPSIYYENDSHAVGTIKAPYGKAFQAQAPEGGDGLLFHAIELPPYGLLLKPMELCLAVLMYFL